MKRQSIECYAAEANHHLAQAVENLRSAIIHAKQAGDALCKAHKLIGKLAWKEWLKQNFKNSYELASSYMRLSRKWKQLKAEVEDPEQLSIERALAILRVKHLKAPREEEREQALQNAALHLRRVFNQHVSRWSREEVLCLSHLSTFQSLITRRSTGVQS